MFNEQIMIIHVWMHWFWITASIKCFLFFAVQMISLSWFSFPFGAEAGLLMNETLAFDNFTMYKLNESSQMGNEENVTSPSTSASSVMFSSVLTTTSTSASASALESASTPSSLSPLPSSTSSPVSVSEDTSEPTEKVISSTVETTSVFSETSLLPEINNSTTEESSNASASIPDDFVAREETSDVEDTFNGGILDVYQYPTKKFTKFSQVKYGKVKVKDGEEKEIREQEVEETIQEEKSLESVKVVEEEKMKINISLSDEGRSANVTETLESTTTSPLINHTMDVVNGTKDWENGSVGPGVTTYESDASEKAENVTIISQVFPTNGSQPGSISGTNVDERNALEDQVDVQDTYKNDTLVIENKVEESVIHTTVEPFPLRNRVAAATSTQAFDLSQSGMNAGSVVGIILGILVIFGLFGAISFVLYRRRYLNKPQVLHDKCSNLDSSGYIDDASLRENSEEMYSLDNDSFLNSLEAMTIQNYWTESVKHTKL